VCVYEVVGGGGVGCMWTLPVSPPLCRWAMAMTSYYLFFIRYISERPALVVSIHFLHSSSRQRNEPLKELSSQWAKNKFPLVHLEEMMLLYTRPEKPWKPT